MTLSPFPNRVILSNYHCKRFINFCPLKIQRRKGKTKKYTGSASRQRQNFLSISLSLSRLQDGSDGPDEAGSEGVQVPAGDASPLVQAPHAPKVVGQPGLVVDEVAMQNFFHNLKHQSVS